MRVELEIPENVTVEVDHLDVTVDGPEGAVTRRLWYPDVTVEVEDD
jgi:large subunit ribosomal protein L6